MPSASALEREVAIPSKHLQEFLANHHAQYVTITHAPAYTAQTIAASTHTPGEAFAQSVIVKLDGRMAMAVLPACNFIDFARLKEMAGVGHAELAQEEEFQHLGTATTIAAGACCRTAAIAARIVAPVARPSSTRSTPRPWISGAGRS
jgi:prolyl-tRNA editing enzyme YbaK/EbsC (Cys-tRNA(Pro) deacylase)